MAKVTDIFQFAAAAWVIEKRLCHHQGSSQMLDGMFNTAIAIDEAVGEKNLPRYQPLSVTTTPALATGAQNPVQELLVLEYIVSSSSRKTWVNGQKSDTLPLRHMGHLEILARFMDAITTDTDGTKDPYLEKTLSKPVTIRLRDSDNGSVGIHTLVEIELHLQPMCQAERAYDFVERGV